MAKNQWRRYQPPGDQRRDEDGDRVTPVKPTPKPKPTSSKGKPTPKRPTSAKAKPKTGTDSSDSTGSAAKIVVGVMIALIIVVIAIVIAAVNNSDSDGSDYDASDVALETLDVGFIQRGLSNAADFAADKQPFSVELDQYNLNVSYYNPNTEKVQTVRTDTYSSEDYEVRVGANYYEEFQPRPFDLAEIQPDGLISAVEAGLEASDEPYSFNAEITADAETGELTIEVLVLADDNVTVIAELDGTVISTTVE